MQDIIDYPSWILLAIGLYSLAAGVGELRQPGFWASMLTNVEEMPALRFLTGMYCLSVGTALYLIAPWRVDDWVIVVIKVIGLIMMIEGVLFLAMGDWMVKFSRKLMGGPTRIWAGISIALGLAAIIIAEIHF